MMINMQENVSQKDEIIICKEIIYAVDIHREAIKSVFYSNNILIKRVKYSD